MSLIKFLWGPAEGAKPALELIPSARKVLDSEHFCSSDDSEISINSL